MRQYMKNTSETVEQETGELSFVVFTKNRPNDSVQVDHWPLGKMCHVLLFAHTRFKFSFQNISEKNSHDCKSGLCNLQISRNCSDSLYKKLELGKSIVQMVTCSRPQISHFQNEVKTPALVTYRAVAEDLMMWQVENFNCKVLYCYKGFLGWLRQEIIHLQCRRPRFDPWVRKIPWRREWLPLWYSCLENP